MALAAAVALQSGVAGASTSAGIADAISLRASDVQDLPGWRVLHAFRESESQDNTGLARCLGSTKAAGSASEALVQSDTVADGSEVAGLESIVIAKPSSAAAASDFTAYRERAYGSCQTALWVALERAGGEVLGVQTAALASAATGGDASFGWRASMKVRSAAFADGLGSAYRDLRGVAVGRYEVFLVVAGTGPPPMAGSAEQRILSLMVGRGVA
jgi:hypothetical protein